MSEDIMKGPVSVLIVFAATSRTLLLGQPILANFKSRVLRALPSKLSSPGTKLQHFEEIPILPSHRYRIPATLLAHDQ